MQLRPFGNLGTVGAFSLGGGGIGQVWGPTTRAEAVATVRAAVAAGVSLLDVAPHYGNGEAELVIGEAFGGHVPAGVRVATKCAVFTSWVNNRAVIVGRDRFPAEVARAMGEILDASLRRMQLECLDLLFLHDRIIPDGSESTHIGVPRQLFVDVVRPTFEHFIQQGRIGAWGISALGVAAADLDTLHDDPPPRAAQVMGNLLNTASALGRGVDDPGPSQLAAAAQERGIGVIGIQPTHGGALTAALDRPLADDNPYAMAYRRAAPFRALAQELAESPAVLALRYALTLPALSTVLLGVKNRIELQDCLRAEAAGPLEAALVERIDATVASAG